MHNTTSDFYDDFEYAVDAYEREDYKTAYKLFLPLAEQGDAEAQKELGSISLRKEKTYGEAVKLYQLATEQGDVEAQYRLGLLYDDGYEVPQDYKEAIKWYRRAVENGHTSARHNLGLMLYEGQGTPQDFKEATKLLKPFGKNYYPSEHAKWYGLEPNYEYAEAQHALEVMQTAVLN